MREFISDEEAKKMIIEIGQRMYQRGFVSSNDGNITIRVGEREVWVTPTCVSKADLTEDKLIKVDFDGNILEGTWKPTTETNMHLNIYKQDDAVMSTAHAHPIYCTVFANLGTELDMPFSPAGAANPGKMPVVPYADPGSPELARNIIPYVKDYHAVLLANHGPIAWGFSPMEAWYTLEEAETYAKMSLIHKFIIGDYRPITRDQLQEVADTHDLSISPQRFINCPQTSDNTQSGRSLDAYDGNAWKLSDETIEKLADRIAAKLKN